MVIVIQPVLGKEVVWSTRLAVWSAQACSEPLSSCITITITVMVIAIQPGSGLVHETSCLVCAGMLRTVVQRLEVGCISLWYSQSGACGSSVVYVSEVSLYGYRELQLIIGEDPYQTSLAGQLLARVRVWPTRLLPNHTIWWAFAHKPHRSVGVRATALTLRARLSR